MGQAWPGSMRGNQATREISFLPIYCAEADVGHIGMWYVVCGRIAIKVSAHSILRLLLFSVGNVKVTIRAESSVVIILLSYYNYNKQTTLIFGAA